MEEEILYASLLEGKLMFGDPFNIPPHADIVVSTLSDYDKKYEFEVDEKKLRKFPMRPGFEPEYLDLFEALMGDLDYELMQGKSIYILDPDGTERSALLAWRLLVRNTRCQISRAVELANEAYHKRKNKPLKWAKSTVPRFNRQMFFGTILFKGGYLRASKRKLSKAKHNFVKDGRHVKNRKQKARGKVFTDSLVDRLDSEQFLDPTRKGCISVRLVETAYGVWHGLSALYLGPITLSFVSMYGVQMFETSYSLNNAFFSLWVFDEHLVQEENPSVHSGKPNPDFFSLHAEIVGSLKPMKRHPLYVRKTPYREGHLPKYIYWQGELIPFKYGKVYIYSALYRYLVSKTRVYRDLDNTLESGANVLILDYDATEFSELGMTYEEFMDDEEQPWTDAHILYGMLTNDMPWLIEDILDGMVLSKT